MKPISVRDRMHQFVDALPIGQLNEIYYLLNKNYHEVFAAVVCEHEDEISKAEADLIVQQYLA